MKGKWKWEGILVLAAIAVVVIAIFLESMTLMGGGILLFGGSLLAGLRRPEMPSDGWSIGIAVIIVLTGAGMLATGAGSRLFGWGEELPIVVLIIGVGGLCVLVAVLDCYKMSVCSVLIQAQCVRIVRHRASRGPDSYGVLYGYWMNGRYYERETGVTYSKSAVKRFAVGGVYPVYMDPKDPVMIREHRNPTAMTILLFVIGVPTLLLGIAGIFVSVYLI